MRGSLGTPERQKHQTLKTQDPVILSKNSQRRVQIARKDILIDTLYIDDKADMDTLLH